MVTRFGNFSFQEYYRNLPRNIVSGQYSTPFHFNLTTSVDVHILRSFVIDWHIYLLFTMWFQLVASRLNLTFDDDIWNGMSGRGVCYSCVLCLFPDHCGCRSHCKMDFSFRSTSSTALPEAQPAFGNRLDLLVFLLVLRYLSICVLYLICENPILLACELYTLINDSASDAN